MQKHDWQLVTSSERFCILFEKSEGPFAVDTETAKDSVLLGVSFSDGQHSCYVPVHIFVDGGFNLTIEEEFKETLKEFFKNEDCIGHNFTYDKRFIDAFFGVSSKWAADTRIMWHLASAPSGPRPYGLKDAQKELLKWEETNEEELSKEVREKGGSLKKGDHYLAGVYTLGKYASLDALSTFLVYRELVPFFDEHEYWPFLTRMMEYNLLLAANTQKGVKVNTPSLVRAHNRLLKRKEAAEKRFLKLIANDIKDLEHDWKDRKIAAYKREYNKVRYENHPEEWERLNLNSDKHKRELFFDKLGMPVLSLTENGKPQVNADTVQQSIRGLSPGNTIKQAMEAYLIYEKANTLSANFSGPYIASSTTGRLHPGFNICGTVSYRLSGFKPYLLNAPFDEKLILKNLVCDDGFSGVHADLSAIEPTMTAHYSDDPGLLKVFRDGLGDVYLDLALMLFPDNKELHEHYNPNIPIQKGIKERFARERKIAKVIQLAVQYTGTKHTVAKNLSKEGFPTTQEEASDYVRAYWRKFHKVAQWEYQLRELNRKQGYLRNVIGRIIRVPDPEYKDLSNRFIQSSGHDFLVTWVLEIYKLARESGIDVHPILLDCHDSTSNQCSTAQVGQLKLVYEKALQNVNSMLGLDVTVKMEMKTFQTLAGLKGEE